MAFLGNIMNAARVGFSAFRETMLDGDPSGGRSASAFGRDEWCAWDARNRRYNVHWALYSNTAYREAVHNWSAHFKATYGTTKHIRAIYNPAGQLGDFFSSHIWGGTLDREAGDGEKEPSALPVVTDLEVLRPAIARLRRDSRWQVNKDVCTLWGAVLGDVAIRVVDDTGKGMVRKELVHPGHLAECDFDEQGHVKGYVIRKLVPDPRRQPPRVGSSPVAEQAAKCRMVEYIERCTRDGDLVVYETFIDDWKPYAWNGEADTWTEPYGFVPMAVVPFRSIGLDWGANCFHGSLSRFLEIDNQASVLGDSNCKVLNLPIFVSGVKSTAEIAWPGKDRARRTPAENAADPEPQRHEQAMMFGPPNSTVTPLAMAHDVKGMVEHIRQLLDGSERKHPELLADTGNLGGNVTAEAIRNARQRASAKVQGIRPGFDDAEVRTNQMALAIGGFRGYEGYQGFDLDSYRAGKLDHAIAHRPVFDVNPMDQLEEDAAFWQNAISARTAGIPLSLFLERNGWTDAEIAELKTAQALEPVPTTTINLGQTGARSDNGGELI